jgi:Ca2+-binding RTX toxin-like protein
MEGHGLYTQRKRGRVRRAAIGTLALVAVGACSVSSAGAATFNPRAGEFSNAAPLLIPGNQGPPGSGTASPYPSSVNASGLYGHVEKATVTLRLTHDFPDDVDMLLVSPNGQRLVLMSQAGDGDSVSNVVLTFDDAAPGLLPNESQITSGSYKPTNYGSTTEPFDPPAPGPPFATTLAAFNGGNPNGQWRLFALDNSDGDVGRVDGWKVSLTTTPNVGRCANSFGLTNAPDTFTGGLGGDRVNALGGNDTVRGGPNRDCLAGNSGADRVRGDSDADRIRGNSGNDRVSGDSSNDRVAGDSGNDRASGGSGNDRVSGGSGRDRVSGNSGRDRLSGGRGRDRIAGNSGNDRISARDGQRDRVNCGSGRDSVRADRIDVLRRCERVSR